MILNGVHGAILYYFTEFCSFGWLKLDTNCLRQE